MDSSSQQRMDRSELTAPIVITDKDLDGYKPTHPACIDNVKHLASYNWLEASTPTIAVPGCPARWKAVTTARQIPKDQGTFYIAQNAARHPRSPLEPLFRAVWLEDPSYDIRDVNVVSDRNVIRKLLCFVDPSTSKDGRQDFTITAESIDDSVIFCRNESKTTEYVGPRDFVGYGHGFEKAYTAEQVKGGTGHHRIISYQLHGLRCVIRFEADGFHDDSKEKSQASDTTDQLSTLLGDMSLAANSDAKHTALTVQKQGRRVPHNTVLEIKTRVSHRVITLDEVAAQLWISQTHKLVRAYHKNGFFSRPAVEDVSVDLKGWQDRKHDSLRLLAALISHLRFAVRKFGRATIRYTREQDKIVVEKGTFEPLLPQDIYLRWTTPAAEADNGAIKPALTVINARVDVDNGPLSKVRVGGSQYHVPLGEIPYLSSLVRSRQQQSHGLDDVVLEHDDIAHFDVAMVGLRSGYRQCLRAIPRNNITALCATLHYLQVDVLQGKSLDDILRDVRAARVEPTSENRRLARDAVFQLIFYILHGQISSSDGPVNELFNVVLFTVSHRRTFKYKTRWILQDVYIQRMRPTAKQIKNLQHWNTDVDVNEDDQSTESDKSFAGNASDEYWSESS